LERHRFRPHPAAPLGQPARGVIAGLALQRLPPRMPRRRRCGELRLRPLEVGLRLRHLAGRPRRPRLASAGRRAPQRLLGGRLEGAGVVDIHFARGDRALNERARLAAERDLKEPRTHRVHLRGAGFAACSGTQTYTVSGETTHTFAVRAWNAGHTLYGTASSTWTLDQTRPPTLAPFGSPTAGATTS